MTRAVILILVVALGAGLLAGCGSSRREIDELRAEQTRSLEQMRADIQALHAQVRRLRDDLRDLDTDLFELSGQLGYGPTAEGPGEQESASQPPLHAGTPEEVAVEPLEVGSLDELAQEVAKLRAELETFRLQVANEQELADLRDPRKTWEAMSDPEKLAWRLDRFARTWSPNIEDPAKRQQFLADVAMFKDRIVQGANLSAQEQVSHYQEKLSERVESETNPRMRHWYQQELRALEGGDDRVIANKLKTYLRYDVAQGLKELAEKYKISIDELRNNGLQAYGGAYGWK